MQRSFFFKLITTLSRFWVSQGKESLWAKQKSCRISLINSPWPALWKINTSLRSKFIFHNKGLSELSITNPAPSTAKHALGSFGHVHTSLIDLPRWGDSLAFGNGVLRYQAIFSDSLITKPTYWNTPNKSAVQPKFSDRIENLGK